MRRCVLQFVAPLRLARSAEGTWATPVQRCFATAEPVAEQSDAHQAGSSSESIAPDMNTSVLQAQLRDRSGTRECLRMREIGRIPAILFSLDGNQSKLLTVGTLEMNRQVKRHGRQGLMCQILQLEIGGSSPTDPVEVYPVLPRILHVNSVSDAIENVTLMYCPPDRRVQVEVPLKIIGEDISPGVKRGGYINMVRRTIKCWCLGGAVPGSVEINVGDMDIGSTVLLGQLVLPAGAMHAATESVELGQPICKIGGRAKREP